MLTFVHNLFRNAIVDTASVKSIHRTFDYREFLDEVYARLSVEDVYTDSSHQFKVSGNRYRGACPFHQSKSGTSFVVNTKSLLFWCEGWVVNQRSVGKVTKSFQVQESETKPARQSSSSAEATV